MKTEILNLDKTPYENGKKSGEFFQAPIRNTVRRYEQLIKDEKIWRKCSVILDKLKAEYPAYYEEFMGKSDGAKVDYKAYFAMMCPEILNISCNCTTITCKKENGSFLISHNEDDDYVENNFCISKINFSSGWLATNDTYNMPFGNGFSWNSFGIVKTINYCHEPNIIEENLPRYFSQRHVSEAGSIEDLIKRCNELRPASGYHMNALDVNRNIAVSIEVYPDSVNVEFIDDSYVHTNHYLHKRYWNDLEIAPGNNSLFRLEKAWEMFHQLQDRNIERIKSILDYRDENDNYEYSIFQTRDDPYMTLVNFSFDMDDKDAVFIDAYVNNEKLKLNYDLSACAVVI